MSGARTRLAIVVESHPLKEPFRITGYTQASADVVSVTLTRDGQVGRGEASGVYYRPGEDCAELAAQIEALRHEIEAGLDRPALQGLLPAGGARNALDCALWDLEAKRARRPAWQLAGLDAPKPLLTTFTCPAADPAHMASTARRYEQAQALKLKLTGDSIDGERVRAVRAARPDVWLGVDANQGFTVARLETLMPVLVEARVQLIEQPFRIGQEALLDQVDSPIPLAADESVQSRADLAAQVGRVQVVNIKLDKCGGLTEGLAMAREARALGLGVMVGNMIGTSLAMAPSFLVGQLCQVVDLDGPVFLTADRTPAVRYEVGMIDCPPGVWGGPDAAPDR